MSRILFVIFLAFVFACTDQTEPPATTSRPDEVTLDDDASGIGLERAGDDIHQRTLARAVLADERVHLAGY